MTGRMLRWQVGALTPADSQEIEMPRLRSIGRGGLVVGLAALAAGLVLVGGSAIAAGDWWLAPQPWIGLGLTLLVVGLALTAVFALLLDVVEPIGRLRWLAVPPAVFVGLFWAFVLIFGAPTTGGTERDIGTMLYSAPEMLVVVLGATLLIALPLVLARVANKGPATSGIETPS